MAASMLLSFCCAAQPHTVAGGLLRTAGTAGCLIAACCLPREQVAALSSTLAEMQATNTAFSGSLRVADSKAAREEQAALRCGGCCVL